jgi:antibiotic biosynthesis monooxygenase (ABM) superfamily enzyme
MALKVVIERRVLPGHEKNLLELLRELRIRCLDEPGYITGETLRDSEDARNIVVISTWFGLGDWRRWSQSQERRDFETRIRQHLAAPERVRLLLEGLSEHHSGA